MGGGIRFLARVELDARKGAAGASPAFVSVPAVLGSQDGPVTAGDRGRRRWDALPVAGRRQLPQAAGFSDQPAARDRRGG